MPEVQAVSAGAFIDAIGVNTHMNYTDGAYANVANVEADLAYLGIDHIRDSVPNPSGGIPASSQISALETLGAHGVKFDLVSSTAISFSQDIAEIDGLDASTPGSVVAVEGPNEINNWPVTYDGLTGQAAATAFQQALYAAIKGNASTAGVAVYNFTGGLDLPLTVAGVLTPNADGSYTLANGQTGFAVELPPGVSTVTVTYTGPDSPISGIFGYPGGDQRGSVYYGVNGQIRYSYDNASGATQSLYVDFADYNQTNTLTGVSVTGPGSLTNLVTFDPSRSLAGQADDANIHPYPSDGGAIGGANIAQNLLEAYGSTSPGPTVITETGYNTDPNDPNGVTQIVQAQREIGGLLQAFSSGVSMTYLYELLDEKADPGNANSEMHYGLFDFENTPKLAAIAIHNLTSILSDDSAATGISTPGGLNYAIVGATASDFSLLLQQSSGTFDLALWNNSAVGTTRSVTETVSFGRAGSTPEDVNVYDTITGTKISYDDVTRVQLALGGDPLILEISSPTVAQITPASLSPQDGTMGFISGGGAVAGLSTSAVLTPGQIAAEKRLAATITTGFVQDLVDIMPAGTNTGAVRGMMRDLKGELSAGTDVATILGTFAGDITGTGLLAATSTGGTRPYDTAAGDALAAAINRTDVKALFALLPAGTMTRAQIHADVKSFKTVVKNGSGVVGLLQSYASDMNAYGASAAALVATASGGSS